MTIDLSGRGLGLIRATSRAGLLTLGLIASGAGQARAEISHDLSGFGTLGGAISDQDFTYQRFIQDSGTINRDSILGLQLDTRFGDAWGLTLQAKAAPSNHSDNAWEPTLSWAFLSWRPSNDLLLRAGKLRVPLLLYSTNGDVGTTFDFARLPAEVYTLTPTADLNGLSLSKTWLTGEREWVLEAYLGTAHTDWRLYQRDALTPDLPAGALYTGLDLDMGGLVLSMRDGENTWRIGLHRAYVNMDFGALPSDYPFVTLAPGIGYYQISPEMPGPGTPTVDSLVTNLLTLGAEISLPNDFEFIGEVVQSRITNASIGPSNTAGYFALLKNVGRWTPYIYWAGIRSKEKSLDLYKALDDIQIPTSIPMAAFLNGTQRFGADQLGAYDQQSLAIGTSYSLTPTSKIKAEWMHVRTGRASNFIDAPSGENSGGRQLNAFSLSYSFMF